MQQFVDDVAALCKMFHGSLGRKTSSGSTVLSALAHATKPREMAFLMNLSRFSARHPDVDIPYGTVKNEALHMQLKSFYRNIVLGEDRAWRRRWIGRARFDRATG